MLVIFTISFQIFAQNDNAISTDDLITVSSAVEIDRILLPNPSSYGLTFDGEFLWVGYSNDLYKINITDGSTIATDSNSLRRYNSLSWGNDSLWATSSDYTKIIKINSTTFNEILTLDHPWSKANAIAWSEDGLYVYDNSIDLLYLLNDSTGEVILSYDYFDIDGIVINDGFLWASDYDQVIKFTKDTGKQLSHIDIDPSESLNLRGLTFTNNTLWVIDSVSDSLIGYDISDTVDLIIYPDQDTYVVSYNGEGINGLSTTLQVSSFSESYIRFPLTQFENVSSVFLEVYQLGSGILTVDIYGVDSDNWDQLTMNWNNKLPTTDGIGSIDIQGENWYSIDVTNFIKSQTDGYATLVIKTLSAGIFFTYSIESSYSHCPKLSVDGTVYKNEMIPGPVTETETKWFTTTENKIDVLRNTDTVGLYFIFPTSLCFVVLVLFRRKTHNL